MSDQENKVKGLRTRKRLTTERRFSASGLKMLLDHEGFHGDLKAGYAEVGYADKAEVGRVGPTMGWGVLLPIGTPVGTRYTIEEATEARDKAVQSSVEFVQKNWPNVRLSQNQFDVLVNMAYQYRDKMLPTKMNEEIKAEDWEAVEANLRTWRGIYDKEGKFHVRDGLQRRSNERADRFNMPDSPDVERVRKNTMPEFEVMGDDIDLTMPGSFLQHVRDSRNERTTAELAQERGVTTGTREELNAR